VSLCDIHLIYFQLLKTLTPYHILHEPEDGVEEALCSSASHRHTQQLADQHLVLAVVQLLAFACFFARDLVLLPAVDLALLVAEVRPSVAGVQPQRPHRASFGLAGEARWDWYRGRAGVQHLCRSDLLLLGAVVRVDGIFEAHESD